jgi:N6-L-threonylcarbamoyladenine synthase
MKFADATFMGIMRWAFYNRLKEIYSAQGLEVGMTYGYITKNMRIANGLPKEHYIDARCISGNPTAVFGGVIYFQKKVRCHNRQIHRFTINKGGIRKRNQAPYEVRGFRLNDTVRAKGQEWFIHGRRVKGAFVLKKLDGTILEIAPSKLRYLGSSTGILTERICVG